MNKKDLFLKAVESGSIRNFQMYFDNLYLEEEFYNNKRPIHIACEKGHFEIVKLLIEKKCNINETGEYQKRPIHIACEKGFLKIVKLLVQNRCKINEKDTSYQNPIHLACSIGHVDIVEILIRNKSKINVFNQWNESPIHLACKEGHCEIVKILISNNCDIDMLNTRNQSALDIAKDKGYREIIKLMEEYRFEIELKKNLKKLRDEMMSVMHIKCASGCDHKFCATSLQKNDFTNIQAKKSLKSGNIYFCKSSTSNMEFAIKVFKVKFNDMKNVEKNINECTKNLSNERIVKYYGVMENQDHLQVLMECIDGISLHDEILNEKVLSWITTMNYTKQILQGLQYLHGQGIIHNNLQPSKILLDNAHNIKLIDFIEYKSTLPTFDPSFRGTINFIAPEIRKGNCYKQSANIWSLGAIIVNMLTGNPPTLEMLLSEIMDNIKKKTKLPPEIKEIEIMDNFMKCLLNMEPTKRSSASELLKHKIFYILRE